MMLAICIPTFNRPVSLRVAVQALLPQLSEAVGVHVLDNCSPEPVTYETLGVIAAVDRARIKIERNSANIGGDANIARCFERCEADYMWLLGDDDPIRPDAVKRIQDEIRQHPDTVLFNFRLPRAQRPRPSVGSGLSAFIDSIDYLGSFMLISNNAYKMAAFKGQVGQAYQYGYACASHLAIVLETLRVTNGEYRLLEWNILEAEEDAGPVTWSLTKFGMRRMALLTLPLTGPQRAVLKRKIVENVRVFNHAFIAALLEASQGDRQRAVFCLQKIYDDNYASPFSLKNFFLYRLYRLALLAPGISLTLIARLKGKESFDLVARTERAASLRP